MATGSLTFTLDTTAPSAPTVALAIDSTDGGAGHNADLITNNAALAIGAPSETATREYSVDGGAWSTTYAAPTVDGSHTVSVRDTDVAGNTSGVSSLTFTLDTHVATPTVALATDSTDGGAGHDGDLRTNNAALASSTPSEAVTREYSVDGGAWSTTYAAPTVDGSHTVSVRDTDVAGNASSVSSLTFTLDTTAPSAPTVALATDSTDGAAGHDSDHITNHAALAIGAAAEPVTREYSVDGGAWSTAYTAPTVDGSHTVSVRDTDVAGNASGVGSLTFTLDTHVATPTVALATDSTDGGAGHNSDHITNAAALTISAAAEPVTREYSVDGGAWSTTYAAPTVDGSHTVSVRDTDVGGNTATGSLTFTLDTTAPSTPTVALAVDSTDGGAGHNSDHLTNNAALAIGAPSETSTREYSVDGGAWSTAYTAPTADGSHTVSVRDTDVAGNASGVGSLTFTLDTHVATPTVALATDSTDGGAGHNSDHITNAAALAISAAAEPVTREYSVDGGSWSTAYTAPTVDGTHTVQVRDTDIAGNQATGSLTFALDTTVATPTVALTVDSTDGGAGHNTDLRTNNAALTISAPTETVTRQYSVDGGSWTTAYTAPTVDGTHTVQVRDTDVAGNKATGSITFTLDTTVSTPSFWLSTDSTDGGAGHNTDKITNNASLTFGAPSETVIRQFSVDGGSWTSSYIPPVVDGTHTATVRYTDVAGNTSSKSLTFTLDTTVATPTVALTNDSTDGGSGHNSDLRTNNAALTISAPLEALTRQYSVDGGSYTSTYTAPTVDGTHTVQVRDTDVAGNTSSKSLTFTLDTTIATPTVALTVDSTDGAAGHSSDKITNNALLTINSPVETVTRQYSVDGGSWTTAYTAPGADGTHTVQVRDTDIAGNQATGSITFTLDTTVAAPTVALATDSTDGAAGHNGDHITNTAALAISAPVEAVTREYSIDGGAWTTTYTAPVVNGNHTVSVRDTDVAGNKATGSLAFTLDTTIATPTVALATDSTDGGAGHNSDHITNNAVLAISAAAEPVTREYSVDGGAWTTAYTAPTVDGTHTVNVRDTDVAGNTATGSLSFTLDTTIATPTVALATDSTDGGAGHDSDLRTNSAALTISAAVEPVTREYSIDGGAWSTTYTAPGDGTHTVQVRDTDLSGNSATGSLTFTLDTTIATPTVALATDSTDGGAGHDSDHITNNAALTISAPAETVTREYSIDGGSWTTAYTAPGDGTHTVSVRDTDVAGNTATGSLTFTLDTTIATPTVALATDSTDGAAGHDSDHITNSALLTISAAAEPVTREYSIDGGVWTTTYTAPGVDGTHTVEVRDTDLAGNTASAAISFTLDTTAPAPTIHLDNITSDNVIKLGEANGNVTITGTVGGDAQAGDTVTLAVNGHDYTGTVTASKTFGIVVAGSDLAADADNTVDASITLTDTAGNAGTAIDGKTYAVDLTSPSFDATLYTSSSLKITTPVPHDPPVGSYDSSPAGQATREVIYGTAGNDIIDHNAAFSADPSQWAKTLHLDFTNFTAVSSVDIVIPDDISRIPGFNLTGSGVTRDGTTNHWIVTPTADALLNGLNLNIVYNVADTATPIDFHADVTVSGNVGTLPFNVTNTLDFSWREASTAADFTVLNASGNPVLVLPCQGVGVDIFAGDGDDVIHAGAGNDLIEGGAGADLLDGGSGVNTATYEHAGSADGITGITASLTTSFAVGPAVIQTGDAAGDTFINIQSLTGSAYNDHLIGDSGANILTGGGGSDILEGMGGADTLIGGSGGNNTATYEHATAGVTASLTDHTINTGDAAGDVFINIQNLTGSAYNDHLIGDGYANILNGGSGGNDILEGMGGGDTLIGGVGGNNTVSYEHAAAGVTASLTDHTINAGGAAGDVFINIQNLTGSAYNDHLIGDVYANILNGGSGGNDILEGMGGGDTLIGGVGGNNTVSYEHAGSADGITGVTASLTDHTINAGAAAGDVFIDIQNLTGSAFNDHLIGDSHANILNGGSGGNDILEGMGGGDTLIGGIGGNNTVSYEHAGSADGIAGVTASLYDHTMNAGDAAGDVYSNIQNLTGSAFSDHLIGDGHANILFGGGGDDILEGMGGADHLDGGSGNNTASYEHASSGVVASLDSSFSSWQNSVPGDAKGDTYINIQNLTGSAYDDTLIGDAHDNILIGGAGNDTFIANKGHDSAYGGDNNDTFYVSSVTDNLPNVIDGGARDADVRTNGGNVMVLQDLVNGGSYTMATLASHTTNIDTLDIHGDSAATAITISSQDVQHMVNNGNASQLYVTADSGDTLTITADPTAVTTTHIDATHTDYTIYTDATHTQQLAQIHWHTV
ncbi:MAG TPA: Ig-like domain-containing protein [Geobacteraceae bacterium]